MNTLARTRRWEFLHEGGDRTCTPLGSLFGAQHMTHRIFPALYSYLQYNIYTQTDQPDAVRESSACQRIRSASRMRPVSPGRVR